MSEHEANEVMADIEGREIIHREEPRAGFDYLLRHLYLLHKIRDKQLYKTISRNEFEIWCGADHYDQTEHYSPFKDMQTF